MTWWECVERRTLSHVQQFHAVLLRPRGGDPPGRRGEIIDGNEDFQLGALVREREHRRELLLRDECDGNFGMVDTEGRSEVIEGHRMYLHTCSLQFCLSGSGKRRPIEFTY